MPAVGKPLFQEWSPSGVQTGGVFSNTNPQEAPQKSMAIVSDLYIDGGSWVGRDGGTTIHTGLSAATTSIDFVKLYESGVYTSYIVWSQTDGKVYFSKGTGDTPALRFSAAGSAPVVFKTVKNRIFMANGVMTPAPQVGRYGAGFRKWGVDKQSTPLTQVLAGTVYATGTIVMSFPYVGVGGALFSDVVGTGTVFDLSWAGKYMYVYGTAFFITSVGSSTALTVQVVPGDPVTFGVPIPAATTLTNGWYIDLGTINISDTTGDLLYAVSYYDPVVGHTSNISPIIEIPASSIPTTISVALDGIVRTGDVVNFTKIIIWRSAHGGGILFPLDLIDNFPAGTTSYTDTYDADTNLGRVVGTFPAPILTNAPPPTDLNYISYWDGRFWGASPSNPGLLYYSARNDPTEITVGVAEECWPAINTIPIEDNDGQITGSRVVGSGLYVMTGQKIYTVLGTTPVNYRLQPVSSKGFGTYHFATTTLPGEDQNSSDILVHMGNDGHMYFLYGPGGDVSFSYPIQDKFRTTSGPKLATNFRLSMFHSIKNTYVVVGDISGETAWMFDIDRKTWFNMSFGSGPYAEGFTTNDGYVFVSGIGGGSFPIVKIKLDDVSTGVPTYILQTQTQVPDGGARTDPKQFQLFSIFGTGLVAGDISATVNVDGGSPITLTAVTSTAVQIFNEPAQFDLTAQQVVTGLTFFYKIFLNNFASKPGPHIQAMKAKYSITEAAPGGEL